MLNGAVSFIVWTKSRLLLCCINVHASVQSGQSMDIIKKKGYGEQEAGSGLRLEQEDNAHQQETKYRRMNVFTIGAEFHGA